MLTRSWALIWCTDIEFLFFRSHWWTCVVERDSSQESDAVIATNDLSSDNNDGRELLCLVWPGDSCPMASVSLNDVFPLCWRYYVIIFRHWTMTIGVLATNKGMTTGGKWRAFCLDFLQSSTQDLRTVIVTKNQLPNVLRTFYQIPLIRFQNQTYARELPFYPMARGWLQEYHPITCLRHDILHHSVGVLQGCLWRTDK